MEGDGVRGRDGHRVVAVVVLAQAPQRQRLRVERLQEAAALQLRGTQAQGCQGFRVRNQGLVTLAFAGDTGIAS